MSPLSDPEILFGINKAKAGTDHHVQQTMETAEWMLGDDRMLCISAVCVLADSAFGNAIVLDRPSGYWPVTTELSLDVGRHAPRDNSLLHGESWPAHLDSAGGLAQGRILGAMGQLVAVGTTRLRYVPMPSHFEHHDRVDPISHDGSSSQWSSTADALGVYTQRVGQTIELFMPSKPVLMNPMGMMHGGALLSAVEIAGRSSLQLKGVQLRTSSLRIAYARPTPGTGTVSFTAEVQHSGQRFGVAHVFGRDNTGSICTVATVTCHTPPSPDPAD